MCVWSSAAQVGKTQQQKENKEWKKNPTRANQKSVGSLFYTMVVYFFNMAFEYQGLLTSCYLFLF